MIPTSVRTPVFTAPWFGAAFNNPSKRQRQNVRMLGWGLVKCKMEEGHRKWRFWEREIEVVCWVLSGWWAEGNKDTVDTVECSDEQWLAHNGEQCRCRDHVCPSEWLLSLYSLTISCGRKRCGLRPQPFRFPNQKVKTGKVTMTLQGRWDIVNSEKNRTKQHRSTHSHFLCLLPSGWTELPTE